MTMAASPESSPGGTSAPKKPGAGAAVGADAAIDGKEAGNAKGAAGYRPFRTPDLHKWAVEPSGHGLPDELQLIDLTPTPRRALTIIDPAKSDGPTVTVKIVVVGDPGTGKTSFIKRYMHDYFSERHKTTVGVDFLRKRISVKGRTVKLQLWDIAKKAMVGPVARAFYKNALGAFLMYEVGNAASFEAVSRWKTEIDDMVRLPDGTRLPVVIVANKCDLASVVDRRALHSFCLRFGFMGWFETSAKLNFKIEETTRFLVEKILEIMPPAGTPGCWGVAKAESGCADFFCFRWCM